MAKLTGGGSNKFVSPGIRTGHQAKDHLRVQQIKSVRQQLFAKSRGYDGAKHGNEVALNVGKGGPGTGRTVMRSGSQSLHGPVNKGESPRSEPKGFDSRGPLKGEV